MAEGNSLADALVSLADTFQSVAMPHQCFHQNSQALRKEFSIPRAQAKQVISECPDCQALSKAPPTLGMNPGGLQPRMIWQTGVTHYAPLGRLKYSHISADTYSCPLHATPLPWESAKHIRAHWLEAFSHLRRPQEIKTDNGPGYIPQATQAFLEKWGIRHKTGIPYNPTGQAIVERAHQTFKTLLNKQKRGSQAIPPRNFTTLAIYTYNFWNRDDSLKSPIDKHLVPNRPAGPQPLVLHKGPLGEGS